MTPRAQPSRFYFGAMSPCSWIASERIHAVLPDAEWRPVFAGGLFRASGRISWGLTDRRAARMADCEAPARATLRSRRGSLAGPVAHARRPRRPRHAVRARPAPETGAGDRADGARTSRLTDT